MLEIVQQQLLQMLSNEFDKKTINIDTYLTRWFFYILFFC